MQQATRGIAPTVQPQPNTWSNSTENFANHQGLVNTNSATGTTHIVYSKPAVTTTMANVSVAKQITTLTTVNKGPQLGIQPVTGLKQSVQIASGQAVRLPAPNTPGVPLANSQITVPQGW